MHISALVLSVLPSPTDPSYHRKQTPCLLAHICGATLKTRKRPGFIRVLLKPWAIACAEWAPGNHVLCLASLRNERWEIALAWVLLHSLAHPPSSAQHPATLCSPQPKVPQGDV